MKKASAMGVLAVLALTPAYAQGPTRTVQVAFEPGNSNRDGYTGASINFNYSIVACYGDLHISYRMLRATLNTGTRGYFYKGKSYQVPAQFDPPRAPSVARFAGRLTRGHGGAGVGNFSDPLAADMQGGCAGQSKVFAKVSAILGGESTEAQRRALEFEIVVASTQNADALRNGAFESHIEKLAADAKRDSLMRVAQATKDSIKKVTAREDSLAKKRAGDSTVAAAGSKPDSSAARSGSSSSASATSSKPSESAEERQERARTAADAAATRASLYTYAEEYFAAGNYQQAIPMYRSLLGSEYDARARSRLQEIETLALAQAGIAVLDAMAPAAEAFARHMGENYPGFVLGVNYTSSYFKGDAGMVGITMGMNDRVDLLPFMPYLDMAMTIDGDKPPYQNAGKMGLSAAIGSTIPKLGFGGTTWVEPHLGWRYVATHINETGNTRSTDKNHNFLMAGLMIMGRNGFARFDAIPMGGTVKFGGAVGYIF